MRELTRDEIRAGLDDEPEECVAVETSVSELAGLEVGTDCGYDGNKCFSALAPKYGDRVCRGWYDKASRTVCGMFHIQCSESEAKDIDAISGESGGSLRPNGKSLFGGFWEFEIE